MIDANRMGGLGVCASAGYMAQAIADGAQLNSFVTLAAWLHDSESLQKVFGEEGVRRRSDNSALPESVRKFYNERHFNREIQQKSGFGRKPTIRHSAVL
jgi:hypothetical protein